MVAAGPPPLAAIALLSAAALAYEILLTRLFSIIQWHHFAYMVISLALLGYGASGSLLAVVGSRVSLRPFFVANATLFGLTAAAAFLVAQRIPFNPLEMAWDARQLLYLLGLYLLLAVPFLCVANALGLALMRCSADIHRIYAWDLAGAGAGALAVVLLLFRALPTTALLVVAALGPLAGALAVGSRRRAAALAALATVGVLLPDPWTALRLSPYKDLSQALSVSGARLLAQRHSPLAVLAVVGSETVPFRHAPGLSLTAPAGPPAQLAVFADGEAAGAITRDDGTPGARTWLDHMSSALPYHLLESPRVLVLGAGGGMEVLQALHAGARQVDAVELDARVLDLVEGPFAGFAGGLYQRPGVRLHVAEARRFVTATATRYDLIQLALVDGFATAASGLHALNESYLYTVEALALYLQRLTPGGVLAITRWLQAPPRGSLKLFAAAVAALQRQGVTRPADRLVLIRSWNTATLVVKNGPLSPTQVEAVATFCRERGFDPAWYPGLDPEEVNRFHRLDRPHLHEGAVALLGPRPGAFLAAYPFDLTPATDDRPYFFHTLKPALLPELLALRARGGLGQVEWGYVVLLATFAQALVAGIVLIVLPARLRAPLPGDPGQRRRVLVFFAAIGLGFLFLELAFIQKFILFLGHPLYAVAVVLCAFLVFAGLGSACSRTFHGRPRGLPAVAILVAGVATAYLVLLPPVFRWAAAWPDVGRILIAVAMLAPLAFLMGMPFPLALARVARSGGDAAVAWAWAINGCASVVSAILAVVLALRIGFTGVVVLAGALYLVAAWQAPAATSEHVQL